MIKISYYLSNIVKKAREQNIYAGITICVLTTVLLYIVLSLISYVVGYALQAGLFVFADFEYALGSIFGARFFIKNRESEQSILKYSIVVAVVGGIISSFFISLYQWLLLYYFYYFLQYLVYTLVTGIFVGLLFGAILGAYYMYKDVKEEAKEEHFGDEFFKDLIDE